MDRATNKNALMCKCDIFTPLLGWVNTPPPLDDTPLTQCHFFCFIIFFKGFINVNLSFTHVYTPLTFVYTLQFQIPRNIPDCLVAEPSPIL